MTKIFLLFILIITCCFVYSIRQDPRPYIYNEDEQKVLQNAIWESGNQCEKVLIAIRFNDSTDVSCNNHGITNSYLLKNFANNFLVVSND